MALPLTGIAGFLVTIVTGDLARDVGKAAEACVLQGLGPSGGEFANCVAMAVHGDDPKVQQRGHGNYMELVRNFSCSQDDAGTPPIRTTEMSLQIDGYFACDFETPWGAQEEEPWEANPNFVHMMGVLPGGNDIGSDQRITAKAATKRCESIPNCKGFTMASKSVNGPGDVWYKSTVRGYRPADGWQTYKLRKQESATCIALDHQQPHTKDIIVDIIRERPLVAILRGFASVEECDTLIGAGGDWDSMSRAYTSEGGHSSYRRSYSANIDPDFDTPESPLTQLAARMYAATRNLTGYKVFPPGQEPINGVLYKVMGDEYRPHCDGDCHGGSYNIGERVATSIIYCHAAEAGGATSFTKDVLKVVPKHGDLLLFAYYMGDGKMTGIEAEHSGCPLRAGKKWIGTQWYREGVYEGWNWEAANSELRRSR